MTKLNRSAEHLLEALQGRAKELNCLYEFEELLNDSDRDT